MAIRRIAVVGGESLLGKEIREVLGTSPMPFDIQLIGADEDETGRVTEAAGEAVVITALDESNLARCHSVILAGSPASSRKAWALTGPRVRVVDATRQLEDLPSARLRAPLAEAASPGEHASPAIIAHPAAVILAQFFARLAKPIPVSRAVVEVYEPASELGQPGIDELHQQTINLFSFKGLPKAIYDEQLAFNLLPAYGSDSPYRLDRVEAQIERHFASLVAGHGLAFLPSIRVVQAPVFHGYSISVWAEFARETVWEEIAAALEGGDVEVRKPDEGIPTNAGSAGQDGFVTGDIRPDRNHPRAWWLWIAGDNLRTTAVNTARLIEQQAVQA